MSATELLSERFLGMGQGNLLSFGKEHNIFSGNSIVEGLWGCACLLMPKGSREGIGGGEFGKATAGVGTHMFNDSGIAGDGKFGDYLNRDRGGIAK
jgi:hypothetical protein